MKTSHQWAGMYNLHRLRLLRELSHRETLAAVATALGYSASAVSHQLSTLEREVGVPLLEPVGRGVRLTAVAESLVAHTEVILAELEQAEAAVAVSRTVVTGTVRIATFQTAAHALLPRVMQQLAVDHPNLTVAFTHISADAAIPALVARDFDVVLAEQYPAHPQPPSPGVRIETITLDPLSLAIPTSWVARSLVELAEAAWVMEPVDTPARRWATAMCRTAGYEPKLAYQTTDVYLHAHLVRQGLAAAFLPALGPEPSPLVHLVPTGHERTIQLATRSGSERAPGIAATCAAIRRSAAR